MANATKYVDNVNGNNGNTGDSEAQAYADIPTAIAAITGGGNTIHVQDAGSSYTLTSTVALNVAGTSTDGPNIIEGYTATPGARDGKPTITSSTNSVALFTLSVSHWRINHFEFTHTAATRGIGVSITGGGSNQRIDDCLMDGCSNGIAMTGGSFWTVWLSRTEAKNSTGIGFNFGTHNSCIAYGCAAINNGGSGFGGGIGAGSRFFYHCLSVGNSGNGFEWGGSSHGRSAQFYNCTAAENTGDGFAWNSDSSAGIDTFRFVNNLAYGNGGYGLNIDSGSGLTATLLKYGTLFAYCNAFGGNTSGARGGLAVTYPGDVSLTADPFTNSAGDDYSLNSTAGGGAVAKAAGFPGAFPGGTTTGYLDIGAVQSQAVAGGGGGPVIIRKGGLSCRL